MGSLARHIFQVDQRRAQRDEIYLGVWVWPKSPPYGNAAAAELVNISRYGFMLRTTLDVIDGSLIAIELPEIGEMKARVAWSMDQQIGGEFLQAIDPADYFNLLAIVAEEQRLAAVG